MPSAPRLLSTLRASRDIYQLSAGSISVALGAEVRHESLNNGFADAIASGNILGAGGEHETVVGDRSVRAIYAETVIPVARDVEMQLALRNDHYASDFGDTWNPKIAASWKPVKPLLLRTSWGHRLSCTDPVRSAPPVSMGFTTGQTDPIRCPVTRICRRIAQRDFPTLSGGNPNLQPRAVPQINAGAVWEPSTAFSLSADYWNITETNSIGAIDEDYDIRQLRASSAPTSFADQWIRPFRLFRGRFRPCSS